MMRSAAVDHLVREQAAPRIFCDMTSILAHARRHTTVTGIQRVVLRIVGHLVATHGDERIRGIAWHPKLRRVVEIDLSFLGPDYRFEEHHAAFMQDMALPFDAGDRDRASLRRLAARLGRLRWKLGGSGAVGRRLSLPSIRPADRIFVPVPTLRNDRYIEYLGRRRAAGNPITQLIHDVIPLKLPTLAKPGHDVEFQKFIDRAADYVSEFLCVSDQTEADLRAVIPAGRAIRARVVPLAHEFICKGGGDGVIRAPVGAIAESPFILCVGTIDVRKNVLALCRVWERLRRDLREGLPRLVLAGQHGWRTEDLFDLLAATGNLDGSVTIIQTPSDAELAFLYRRCAFTVFPSLYEGWGLPIGESLWFGKYCIASSAASMRQVGGDLVDYVDPHDPEDMRRAILRAIREPAYVRERERRIRRSELRLWSDVAEAVLGEAPAVVSMAKRMAG